MEIANFREVNERSLTLDVLVVNKKMKAAF
jgi:hypothetical protein